MKKAIFIDPKICRDMVISMVHTYYRHCYKEVLECEAFQQFIYIYKVQ